MDLEVMRERCPVIDADPAVGRGAARFGEIHLAPRPNNDGHICGRGMLQRWRLRQPFRRFVVVVDGQPAA